MIDEDVDEADDPEEMVFLRELARVADHPPPDGELRTGDRLGRFAIVKRLGAGGMGDVFEAKDETLGRAVALKVMRRTSDEARRRFVQEARAAAAVAHSNLIAVHEVGEAEGRAFIVMELVRGRTLRSVMADKPTRDVAIRILQQVARGVAAAHAAGIVHRDLKPENVMVRDDGSAVVLDFGVARLTANGDDGRAQTALAVTGTGVVVGTPQYMSPEQALGREVDTRSDVYSFGVLGYELLTGTRPVPDPLPANISPLVDGVLERCLAADRMKRYADAGQVRDALEGQLARRRRRWRMPLATGLAVAVCVLVGWRVIDRTSVPAGRPFGASANVKAASAEAVNAYRAGFQQLHDAMFFESVRSFEHATEVDPSFAAAHLRLGILKRFYHSAEEARHSYEIAVRNRDQLDERDRVILQAVEPMIARDPYDYGEANKRLLVATKRYPRDVELIYYLGLTYSELGQHDQLLSLVDSAAAIEPRAPLVWSWRAFTLMYLGDRARAREAAIECKRLAPMQSGCAFELGKILNDSGACDELETVLRGWRVASPDNPKPSREIARLMLSEGRSLDAVRDMIERARDLTPEAARRDFDETAAFDIAWATGDFATAETQLRAWLEPWNPAVAEDLIDLLEETGRGEEARPLAEKFFMLGDAGFVAKGTSDLDLYNDRTGIMLATLARHGGISADELTRRRAAWIRDLQGRIGGLYAQGIWAQTYALPARTAEEATVAVLAMPAQQPAFFWFSRMYGAVGRTLVLANRPADALPYLTRAAQRCFDRDPRDYYYLGLAQEATGNTASACASYAELVVRWGNAKPRSLSVEQARAHSAALHCPGSLRQ